jgi:DNA-binding MarR family transcriptional regulator
MVKRSRQRKRQQAADAMHSAALHLLREVRKVDAGMSLDGPRASVLSVLVFGGPKPVSRLAELEQVSAPAITKLVNALEEQGLVWRAAAENDRRVVLVTATTAGERLLVRGRAARVRAIGEMFDGLTEDELDTIHQAADLIERSLRSDWRSG